MVFDSCRQHVLPLFNKLENKGKYAKRCQSRTRVLLPRFVISSLTYWFFSSPTTRGNIRPCAVRGGGKRDAAILQINNFESFMRLINRCVRGTAAHEAARVALSEHLKKYGNYGVLDKTYTYKIKLNNKIHYINIFNSKKSYVARDNGRVNKIETLWE